MSTLGYREDVDEPEDSGEPNRGFLVASLILLAFLFFLDILSWFTERGGVFSIISALVSVHSKPLAVDIDESGLWLPFTIVTWLIVVGFCRVFDIRLNVSTRAKAFLPALIIVGGGFVLNEVIGEPIVTHYMASQGYSRCEAGDWAQGNGKSRVWFADYVLHGVECRQRVQSVPERSLFN